jgi:hypothetical protein
MSDTRPTPEEILSELVSASDGMTEEQLKTAALDVLHFLWITVNNKGGQVFIKLPEFSEPHPFIVTVPGLIEGKE